MNFELAKAHLSQQPELKRIIASIEMPNFAPSGKVYYDLLESIVSQQLSVKIATIIFDRFLNLFPDKYPHPELLVATDIAHLRTAGLSNQKAAYLQNVASFSLENNLETHDWDNMSDAEIIQFLTQIKGVGKWTVEMILMFTIGRPDVFPIDDLGIQQGMCKIFNLSESGKLLKTKMIETAEPWRPYRTVASRYIWRWKDSVKG